MLRLSVILTLVAVSCCGDIFDDPDGLGLSWLYKTDDQTTNVTTRRLVNLLHDLEHRAFANQPATDLDRDTRDDDDSNVAVDGDSEDDEESTKDSRVNTRRLVDILQDLEERMYSEQDPADLEIDERLKDEDDLNGDYLFGQSEESDLDYARASESNHLYSRDFSDLEPNPEDLEMAIREDDGEDFDQDENLFASSDAEYGQDIDQVASKRIFRGRRRKSRLTIIMRTLSSITKMLAGGRPRRSHGAPRRLIPNYFYNFTITDAVYDKIDYTAARSTIEDAVREAFRGKSNPRKILFQRIAPVLYNLRSGCTVNLLQRLLAAGFNRWCLNTTAQVVEEELGNPPNDSRIQRLMDTVNHLITAEINRTVFGFQFQRFEGVLNFMALALHKDKQLNPPEFVYNMSTYMLQCTRRPFFLENFIKRTRNLRSRLLDVEPAAFARRMLRSTPRVCGAKAREMFSKTLADVSKILLPIQERLKELFESIYNAVVFEADQPIEDFFQNVLDPTELTVLRKVLGMLQTDGPASSARATRRYEDQSFALLERLLKRLEA